MKDKGFWDGGAPGHNTDDQTAGRPSGFPGVRKPGRAGVRTNIDFPDEKGGSSEGRKD